MRIRGPAVFFLTSIIVFLAFSASMSFGQNVTIKGTARGAENKTIILKNYSDYFTLNEQFLAISVIDSAGKFEIKCTIPALSLAVIHIEYYSGEIYLEQGKTYNVEIKNLVFNEKLDKVNYNLNPFTCYIKVISKDKEELNNLSQKLNIMYNTFIRDNLFKLKTRDILPKVDTFMMAANDTFRNTSNGTFKDYMNYRIASLKLLTDYSDPYKLMLEYIYQKPVLYDNIEYMSFLSAYFENYFKNLTNPLLESDLYTPINVDHSYANLMDVLGKDTLLINEKLREAVMLSTLNYCYSSSNFNKKNIILILRQVTKSSKFDKHRQIAGSMLAYYTRFDKGMPAPDFSLKSIDNKNVSLSSFRGKYVYLNFFSTWCLNCKDELELMKKLRQNYGDDIVFISIATDREFMNMYHFVHDQKYNWLFLHLKSDYDLLESYGIYAYPSFVLIDKNGNFVQSPALKPSENIEHILTDLLGNENKTPDGNK